MWNVSHRQHRPASLFWFYDRGTMMIPNLLRNHSFLVENVDPSQVKIVCLLHRHSSDVAVVSSTGAGRRRQRRSAIAGARGEGGVDFTASRGHTNNMVVAAAAAMATNSGGRHHMHEAFCPLDVRNGSRRKHAAKCRRSAAAAPCEEKPSKRMINSRLRCCAVCWHR